MSKLIGHVLAFILLGLAVAIIVGVGVRCVIWIWSL